MVTPLPVLVIVDITCVIIEAVMAAQSSFEFTSVVEVGVGGGGGGGGCDIIFNITEGGLELTFFCFGGGLLSKFLLPPPLLIINAQSLTI